MKLHPLDAPMIPTTEDLTPLSVSWPEGTLEVTLEVSAIASQANQSVTLRHGQTVILATLTDGPPPATADFRPLTVDYYERMGAVGSIPGNYQRREGRQSDHEVRVSRVIDRAIRPLFDLEERRELHVVTHVLSADSRSDLIGMAITASGAVAYLSELPFQGPIAGASFISSLSESQEEATVSTDEDAASTSTPDEELKVDQVSLSESIEEPLSLTRAQGKREAEWIIAANAQGVVMIEGGGTPRTASALSEALQESAATLVSVWSAIESLNAQIQPQKIPFVPTDEVIDHPAFTQSLEALADALGQRDKRTRETLYQRILTDLQARVDAPSSAVALTLRTLARAYLRSEALEGRRQDGRALNELRSLTIQTDVLPRSAGSSLITRGGTQSLVAVTLGQQADAPTSEGLFGRVRPSLFCHYNFPGFATHDIRPSRNPNRREIGHGLLIQRALTPLFQLPKRGQSVRLVADILASDGASSTTSLCGATLALAQAKAPLLSPVVALSIGLVTREDERGTLEEGVLLLDISGDEDFYGDMDFKVIGCAEGITGLQLDNKLGALSWSIIDAALKAGAQAHDTLLDTLTPHLDQYAPAAPRFHASVEVAQQRVGRLIGKKGQNLKALCAEFDVEIDIDDHHVAHIFGEDQARVDAAMERVRSIGEALQAGKVYEGVIDGVKDFGVFVQFNQHTGLVHVSELSKGGEAPIGQYEIGQPLKVKLLGVDRQGRLKLSHLAAL